MTSNTLLLIKTVVVLIIFGISVYLLVRAERKKDYAMLEALRDHNWEE